MNNSLRAFVSFSTQAVLCIGLASHAYSAPQYGRFEINVDLTQKQSSQSLGSTQFNSRSIITVIGNKIFHESILPNQGDRRRNTGIAFLANSTISCHATRINPAGPSSRREKGSFARFHSETCVATSRISSNTIELSRQNSNEMDLKTNYYTARQNLRSYSTIGIQYDLDRGICNLNAFSEKLSYENIGTSGDYPNNSDTTEFTVISSSCAIRKL